MSKKKEKPAKKKRGRGQPPKNYDPEMLKQLAMRWCTYVEMAEILGCSTKTLQEGKAADGRKYADIIEAGRNLGNASLRRKLFEQAMAGNTKVLIFLAMVQLGMNPKQQMELSVKQPPSLEVHFVNVQLGPDGDPIHLLSAPESPENSDAPVIDMMPVEPTPVEQAPEPVGA